MKQNTIIILLAVVATLLLVSLIQGRFPPTAQAGFGAHEYQMACAPSACFAIDSAGILYSLHTTEFARIGPAGE